MADEDAFVVGLVEIAVDLPET